MYYVCGTPCSSCIFLICAVKNATRLLRATAFLTELVTRVYLEHTVRSWELPGLVGNRVYKVTILTTLLYDLRWS